MDGKPQADYRQPASMGMYREMARRYGGNGASGGGDPLGLRGNGGEQRPAPPKIPSYSGKLNLNPVTQAR